MRWKAALTLAALYALCVLMAPVAFAFSGAPAHCLTDAGPAHVHQRMAEPAEVHAHGAGHSHGSTAAAHEHLGESAPDDHAHGDGKAGGNCCGLFCITGLAQERPDFLTTPVVNAQSVSTLADVLTGRGPDRINKPPIG
jgi:hypothetical protein